MSRKFTDEGIDGERNLRAIHLLIDDFTDKPGIFATEDLPTISLRIGGVTPPTAVR